MGQQLLTSCFVLEPSHNKSFVWDNQKRCALLFAPQFKRYAYKEKEIRLNRIVLGILLLLFLSACSESENDDSKHSNSDKGFQSLPSNESERTIVNGRMSFWMYEGDAGCYGTLAKGISEIQLWIDADSCIDKSYSENQKASVEITFNQSNQYGPGKTYTITAFK